MKTSEILKAAKALIEKLEHWTKNEFARDINGIPVNSFSSNAVCFCSVGAVEKVAGVKVENKYNYEAFVALRWAINADSIAVYNDRSSHAEVISMFDKAIKFAERNENAKR